MQAGRADLPKGRPAAFDEAPAGCEEAQAERERGLSEGAKRPSSGPSARKTSQWLVFSEVGKALAFPRAIPVLLGRSDRAVSPRMPGRASPAGRSMTSNVEQGHLCTPYVVHFTLYAQYGKIPRC